MAVIPFTIWDSQTFGTPQGIVAGVPIVVASSSSITNPGAQLSLRVAATFESITPNNNDGGPGGVTYDMAYTIEEQTNLGDWVPIAYQFSGINRTDQAPCRQVILQPGIPEFNAGIDDVIFIGSSELARISRQQGILPDTAFRLTLWVTEYDPGGPTSFSSVTLSATGERYDA